MRHFNVKSLCTAFVLTSAGTFLDTGSGLGHPAVHAADVKPDPKSNAPAVPPESRVKKDAVHGLQMSFYDVDEKVPKGIDSLDDARAYVAAHQPTLEYAVNQKSIHFPREGPKAIEANNISLGEYLFGAVGLSLRKMAAAAGKGPALPPRMDEKINQRSIMIYTGFINVPRGGIYSLQVQVDDGDEVSIGDTVVHTKTTFDVMFDWLDSRYAAKVFIKEPGIYPIRVLHWDRMRELGVHVYGENDPRCEMLEGHPLLSIIQVKDK
jgi:hypothetical protein